MKRMKLLKKKKKMTKMKMMKMMKTANKRKKKIKFKFCKNKIAIKNKTYYKISILMIIKIKMSLWKRYYLNLNMINIKKLPI
jgi:hypothetical protein